jgi:surface polysaccharide O-acyltransferase-like enzyme
MNQVKQNRHYELDWLRVLAMFAIFLFHCMVLVVEHSRFRLPLPPVQQQLFALRQ